MANTIVYYDETGKIIMTESGNYIKPTGTVSYIETEIPSDYSIVSVDPETNEPILEELPKTDEQLRLEALEEQMNALLGVESEVTA